MATELSLGTHGYWQDYVSFNEDDNVWHKITSLIGQALASISTSIGYKTDIGAHVFLHRPTDIGMDELPAINYRDTGIEPSDEGVANRFTWKASYEIEVKLASGSTTPTEARKMVEDICKCLGTGNYWDGLATRTEQPTATFVIEQADKFIGAITMNFAVIFSTAKWTI